MRKQQSLRYPFISFLTLFLFTGLDCSLLANDLPQIVGCAGVNTELSFCTFCEQVELEIDFQEALNGNPRAGGTWNDLDNSGLDLMNLSAVNISSLNTGTYRFQYAISGGGGCPADAAILSLKVTGANTIACVDQVNALLKEDCTYELTVANVLSGKTVCNDQLDVLVFDFETGFYGNVLGPELIGRTLDVVVFEEGCPNPVCTSKILLEDKGIPDLSNIDWLPDEITLYCHDLDFFVDNEKTWTDPSYKYYLGGPIINDCSGYRVAVTDRVVYQDCGPVYAELQRTFIITDAAGNISSTTLIADFVYPQAGLASKFEDIVINDCTPQDAVIPETYPFIINYFGDTISLREAGCNYSIGFEDREFYVCGGSLKIEREIRFFDWCEDRYFPIDTVVIKIGDFAAPIIENKQDTAIVAVSAFQCTATLSMQELDLENLLEIDIKDCHETITARGQVESYLLNSNFVDSSFQKGQAINTGFYINNIPVGLHRLILTLSDGCKSEATDTVYFRVVDRTLPVMACDDRLLVSMSEGPYAQISYSDINEGSQDNCQLARLKIRRQVDPAAYSFFDYNQNGLIIGEELDSLGYTRFDDPRTGGTFVEYYCSDLSNPQQIVELWGWDNHGNSSTCWTNILLEDKIPPACKAPRDTIVACYNFQADRLDLLGLPELSGTNCGGVFIETLPAIEETNQCGAGIIVRRFQAIKNKDTDRERVGPICVQTITIQNIQDYYICFPEDLTLDCTSDPYGTGPEILGNNCALFAQHQEDVRLETDNEACYKILRTYEIINWCEYIPDHAAVVIDRDVDGDKRPGDEKICVIVRPNRTTYLDRDSLETDTIPNKKGYWTNSIENQSLKSTGFWKYTQHIKVIDQTPPALSFSDTLQFSSRTFDADGNCFGIVDIPFSVLETCNTFLSIQLSLDAFMEGGTGIPLDDKHLQGNFPDYRIIGDFPLGKHQFLVEVNDGCGNVARVEIPFEVIDDKGPSPICTDVVIVEMSYLEENGDFIPQAAVDVQAFLGSPIYDCSGQGENGLVTDFSINIQDSLVLRGQKNLFFDCLFINQYTPIEVHAWDQAGNHGFCSTYVEVQDKKLVCNNGFGEDGTIAGSIQTADGRMVEKVTIELSGGSIGILETSSAGDFSFDNLREGANYTIKPYKNDDLRNGVSTLDLIKVQKHVLGAEQILDPYRLIAADVNNSRSVTTLDMIQLRKVILNVTNNFQNNTSWRFIEMNYTFPDPQQPWLENFPEIKQVEVIEDLNNVGFIAIKVGDVNASAAPNSLVGNADPRSQEMIYLDLEEKALYRDEKVIVPLQVDALNQLEGLQGTLQFDETTLTLVDIDYGLLNPGQLGLFVENGQLSFSWNKPENFNSMVEKSLFTLHFKVKENTFLSRSLELNSAVTMKEAYSSFAERMDLQLRFIEKQTENTFFLGQNQPNPFRSQTRFPYFLESAGLVQFEVINFQGQVVWQQQLLQNKGLNHLELRGSLLPVRGIYQLRITSSDRVASKSFIYH